MNKISIFIELIQFLIKNKRYWIIPIIIVLVFLGMLLILTESSVLSPFIYKLKFYFKKFATYFTITFLLFCLINVIAFVVINNTKRRSFETILQPEKILESNPRLMQEIYLGKSVNEISKIQSDCPQNVSHPTLSFMMQPI
ncbi:MAG: DUF5989 family protein, partial [Flavobacterium sp.]|nr:DUF5989 family protein [Flavobacterium sp.]